MTNKARLAVAGLWQETNTYSSRATSLEDFEQFEYLDGESIREAHASVRSVIGGFLSEAGGDAVMAFSAAAWPAGPADQRTADGLLSRLHDSLSRCGAVDGVLLNLHGAMVAEGHDDMELDAVSAVRAALGPDVPIGAVLDFHGNPSGAFLAECAVVVGYETYPHVDMFDRGVDVARLLVNTVARGQRSIVEFAKLPLLTSPVSQGTADAPMRQLVGDAHALAKRLQLDQISVLPGFPYSDVARAGLTIVATANVERRRAAQDGVKEMVDRVMAVRGEFAVAATSPAEAVGVAAGRPGPTVLADVADNIGGGSPGDGTVLFEALLAANVSSSLVVLCDPVAASAAHRAGVGAVVHAVLGGHSDDLHGQPVRVDARVTSISSGHYVSDGAWMGGRAFEMGRTAVLECGPVTVVVTSVATPPFHRAQLTSLGLKPTAFRCIVAKGALAWKDAYAGDIAGYILVDTPGCCPAYPERLPRTKAPELGDGRSTTWMTPNSP